MSVRGASPGDEDARPGTLQMSRYESVLSRNTIRRPRIDGPLVFCPSPATGSGAPPFAFTRRTLESPTVLQLTRIEVPSGTQAGCEHSLYSPNVSCRASAGRSTG
jgi:hypothetical protein